MDRGDPAGGLRSGGLRAERHPLPEDAGLIAVEAVGLTRRFGEVVAVGGLNLVIRRGEVCGLVGPDGAGKTTALRLLAGAISPTAGGARVLGHDVVTSADAVKARIGYLAQRFSLYDDLTVEENLRFVADLYEVPEARRRSRAERLLAFTGLVSFRGRLAQHLSGGMRQKLALAAALVHDPELLLLDEPTTGVDPISRREFWRILSGLRGRGVTVIYATPYMDEAERCDTIAFLSGGRLLARGGRDEVRGRLPGRVLEIPTQQPRRLQRALAGTPEVADVQVFGDKVHLRVADDRAEEAARRALVVAGGDPRVIRHVTPSLEDVFMYLSRAARERQG